MKASELRIGNLIEQPNGINTVFLIDDFEGEESVNSFYIKDISPITLTEEWLIKFGFVQDKEQSDFPESRLWFKEALQYIIRDKDSEYLSKQRAHYFGYPIENEIKYVHQFQNLYFSLTGNELNTGGEGKG